MKRNAMLLFLFLGIGSIVLAFILKNVFECPGLQWILLKYGSFFGFLIVGVICLMYAWDFYKRWQFEVRVNEMVREFDQLPAHYSFKLSCSSDALANAFLNQRTRQIKDRRLYRPEDPHFYGVKTA